MSFIFLNINNFAPRICYFIMVQDLLSPWLWFALMMKAASHCSCHAVHPWLQIPLRLVYQHLASCGCSIRTTTHLINTGTSTGSVIFLVRDIFWSHFHSSASTCIIPPPYMWDLEMSCFFLSGHFLCWSAQHGHTQAVTSIGTLRIRRVIQGK